MLVKVYAAALQGINAIQVTIEVNALRGIRFFLVGLPDNAVKESHERIRSALEFNGLKLPSKQIVVNMAPADIRKEGSAYDLPIAIGIMAAARRRTITRVIIILYFLFIILLNLRVGELFSPYSIKHCAVCKRERCVGLGF